MVGQDLKDWPRQRTLTGYCKGEGACSYRLETRQGFGNYMVSEVGRCTRHMG